MPRIPHLQELTMKLFRFESLSGPHLGVEIEGARFDLTATAPHFRNLATWLALADPVAAVQDALEASRRFPIEPDLAILPPIDQQEVWASGVTYLRSKVARMDESRQSADIYDRVYEAERPELFFKSMPSRVAGPLMPIRIRRDSTWNVPEPELVLVISSRGSVVGTTIGNDMSSRSIEGDNPLYLPQAKIYEGSCAIGPSIDLMESPASGRTIQLTIERDARVAFNGEISTSKMRRSPAELARWLFMELQFPAGVFLFTGTGIVPPNDFTLKEGDIVKISIEGIGTLENRVAKNS
jgi:2-dehydro-3-deoxy-D-arabinonate dehydratase